MMRHAWHDDDFNFMLHKHWRPRCNKKFPQHSSSFVLLDASINRNIYMYTYVDEHHYLSVECACNYMYWTYRTSL